jgi:alpha-beta hydrolase superfamily lysophospholipase
VTVAPVHCDYGFDGAREYCLSFGPAEAQRTILIVPPLFDEMNRVRHMLVEAMRQLAARGVQSLLPDLPGCNESLADLTAQSIDSWRAAVGAAANELGATHIASLRGGALIDNATTLPVWWLAPVKGASLLRTMLRMRIAAEKEAGRAVTAEMLLSRVPLELGGNILGSAMLGSLEAAEPIPLTAAVEAELAAVSGQPLWLRAEPQHSAVMSKGIAAALDRWSAECGG